MKLSDLIADPEHRAEMWRRLYFNDAYFCRLWQELEHYNATPNKVGPPLKHDEMLTIALLMLAQHRSEMLDEHCRRATAGLNFPLGDFRWYDKDLEDAPPLFHKTDDDVRREFELIEKLGITTFLAPVVEDGHVFSCVEKPIQEHPKFKDLVAKFGPFTAVQTGDGKVESLVKDDGKPLTAEERNGCLQTLAALNTEPPPDDGRFRDDGTERVIEELEERERSSEGGI